MVLDYDKAKSYLEKYFVMYYGEDKRKYINNALNETTPLIFYKYQEYLEEYKNDEKCTEHITKEINAAENKVVSVEIRFYLNYYGPIYSYLPEKLKIAYLKLSRNMISVNEFENVLDNLEEFNFVFDTESKITSFKETFVINDLDYESNEMLINKLDNYKKFFNHNYYYISEDIFNDMVCLYDLLSQEKKYNKMLALSNYEYAIKDIDDKHKSYIRKTLVQMWEEMKAFFVMHLGKKFVFYDPYLFSIYDRDLMFLHEINHAITSKVIDDKFYLGVIDYEDSEKTLFMEIINQFQTIEVCKLMHNDNFSFFSDVVSDYFSKTSTYSLVMPMLKVFFKKNEESLKNYTTTLIPKDFISKVDTEFLNALISNINNSYGIYFAQYKSDNRDLFAKEKYQYRKDTLELYRSQRKKLTNVL